MTTTRTIPPEQACACPCRTVTAHAAWADETLERIAARQPDQDYDHRLAFCDELSSHQSRWPTVPVSIRTVRAFLDCFAVDGKLAPELAKLLGAQEVCAFVELLRCLGSSPRAENLLSEYMHERRARHADQAAETAEAEGPYWSPVAHP